MIGLLLLGCTSWIDQEPGCDQDIYTWSDDLLAFILTGDDSGEFDFDPEDEPRDRVSGSYDPSDGDFEWKAGYDEDFYLKKVEAEGFGTAFHNGDLDLLWTEAVTDMLDEVTETVYRVQRDDCDMTLAAWDASGTSEDAFVMQGSYEDGEVWAWEAEGEGFTARGSLRQNLSRTQVFELDSGWWQGTNAKPDGETDSEFTGECIEGYYCEGSSTLHFEGDSDGEILVYEGDNLYLTATTESEWDGSGTEHHVYTNGLECDFTTDSDDDCSYECNDGSNGSC